MAVDEFGAGVATICRHVQWSECRTAPSIRLSACGGLLPVSSEQGSVQAVPRGAQWQPPRREAPKFDPPCCVHDCVLHAVLSVAHTAMGGLLMSLEEFNYIAEIVASVAVIASLIYVGRQVRDNTKATHAAAAQSFADTMNGYVGLINASPNLARVLDSAANGLNDLKRSEVIQFGAFLDQLMINAESLYYQNIDGVLDERLWDTYRHVIVDILSQKGTQEWWERRRHWFGQQFANAVDQLSSEVAAKPMHFASVET